MQRLHLQFKSIKRCYRRNRNQGLLRCLLYMGFCGFLFPGAVIAEDNPPYEEISVFFNVPGFGGKEVEAVILNEQAYLSLTDVFGYLKIRNQASSGLDSVSGFFLEQNRLYTVDKSRNQITLDGKIYPLSPDDMIQTSTALYLKSTIYGKIFGLNCVFNFRSLSVQLDTKLDLPVIREQRQELMRSNAGKLKNEIVADTLVRRRYSHFNAGALDWSLNTTQVQGGFKNTRLNMRLGTVLAGGETNIFLNYDSHRNTSLKEQYYQWRYVNNDAKFLRQVMAGKVTVPTISSVFTPVLGVKLTNTPTTYRRSFDTYTYTDFTEPDWVVELYVNNTLLDYVRADASGAFTFRIPLIYGTSAVKLRFYGPWGEMRTEEKAINVPYNFLPTGEMEYSITAGVLEDGKQSRFSRADFKYGVNRRITIGSGAEYLSSIASGRLIPFANTSLRPASNMLLTAEYAYGVRSRALLNYRLPSDFLLELNYTRYKKGQTAIYGGLLEERKVTISKPFRTQGFSGFSRLTVNQITYPTLKQNTADLLLSGSVKGLSSSIYTFASRIDSGQLNVSSNLAMTFRVLSGFTLKPLVQYNYNYKRLNEVKLEIEKQLFNRGFLNFEYSNNVNYNTHAFGLGLRFDLSFVRTSLSARHAANRLVFSQSFSGGIIHDDKVNYFKLNNRTNVGRGGLVIYPFLDINSNNRRDKDEPKVTGLQLKINGGRIENNARDTTVQVFDLEPYTHYLLELNTSGFNNIAWQLKNSTYKVTVEANKLQLIEIPVKVSGEVSGMVYSKNDDKKGKGRILVNFYRNGKLAGQTMSEIDGYFTFLGLSPGDYTASLDPVQMGNLKMTASPASMPFNIASTLDGDFVDDVVFKLLDLDYLRPVMTKLDLVPAGKILNPAAKVNFDNLPTLPVSKLIEAKTAKVKKLKDPVANFSIMANALGDKTKAAVLQKSLSDKYGHSVRIYFSGNNYYQLTIENFEKREDAEALLPDLAKYGLKGSYIVAPRMKIAAPVKVPDESQKVPSLPKQDATYFAIIAGSSPDEAGIKMEQERVLKVLRFTSFPIKKDGVYKLIITGFADRKVANIFYKRLLGIGLEGYIISYKKSSP